MSTGPSIETEIKKEHIAGPSTLPFHGGERHYKALGIIGLLFLVVILNCFILHKSKKPRQDTENETYSTASIGPITKQALTVPTVIGRQRPSQEDDNKLLQQKIAAAKAQDFISRLQAPQSVGSYVSNNAGPVVATPSNTSENTTQATAAFSEGPNTAFLLQASAFKAEREQATHFGPLQYVIGQGKFIFGTLAVAVNSDLPGQIEAIVSQDVYGEQGKKVLIQRGSHLIGEYKSGLVNNQCRLFMVWTRIKGADGIDVQLGSEGTDTLGRSGQAGLVDDHFFARFGSAVLISMIGAGAANVGVGASDQYNSASAYRSGIASAMSEQGKSTFAQNINLPPTINIAQGEKIVVFVNRDLDFSRVYQ